MQDNIIYQYLLTNTKIFGINHKYFQQNQGIFALLIMHYTNLKCSFNVYKITQITVLSDATIINAWQYAKKYNHI